MTTLPAPTPRSDDFDPFAGPAVVASVPATPAQREIWAATWMGDDASLAFNESVAFRLRGPLDEAALRAAVTDLVARHESLRATFSADGLVMIVLEPPAQVPVAVHDWRLLATDARDAAWAGLCARVVAEPFDLVGGPLVRFDLARLGADDHALVMTAHHIVCDGWSFGVIAAELGELYSARGAGRAATLAAAPAFTAYAREATGAEARAAAEAAERYWVAQFPTPVAPLDLPTDRPRPPARSYAAAREEHVIPADVVQRAARAGARGGRSLFATLFGAFGVLLHRLSGQEELVIGVPTAGQPSAGAPGLVGHMVNTIPVRLRLTPDTPLGDALAHARGQVLDGYDHQQVTFGTLLARLPFARDPGRPPLVSVAFNLDRGIGASGLPFAGLAASLRSVPRSRENFDLFVNAVELDGAVTVECQYNTALYDRATVRSWLAAFERVVAGTAAEGADAVAVGDVAVAAGAPVAGPALALPAHPGVHRLIEAQAGRTPDAVAVDDGVRRLTYRELDARATRLARHLRARGVRRGAYVGLCLERTAELLVAVVAVLKAGGAYVPLDPGYPVDRLAYMAADAGLGVLVTEEQVRRDTPLPAAHVVSVDGPDAAAIAAESDAPLAAEPDADAGPEDPAYVIYTSGSTGRPKGVVVRTARR
jgi:hypothetical protein